MAAVGGPLQPDFAVLEGSLRTFVEQCRLIPNIPLLQNNNNAMERIMQSLDRINQRLDSIDQRLDSTNQRLDSTNQRIDDKHEDLKSYVDTRDRNAQARLHNSQVSREPRLQLMALWSLTENDTIPNFPEDLAAIERLEEVDLNNLLQHLGRVPRGPIRRTLPDLPDRNSKLAAFKREIGITVKYSSEVGMI